MKVKLCRFTHNASLIADAARLFVVTDQGQIFKLYRTHGNPRIRIPHVIEMVQLREGVVHALCEDGQIIQITTGIASAQDFQVQVLGEI
jgi:hypothetical protein